MRERRIEVRQERNLAALAFFFGGTRTQDRYCCRARRRQPSQPRLAKIAREEVVAPCITRASVLPANKSGSCSRT